HFTPAPSLQIQFLRHLASTAPYITALEQLVFATYRANPSVIKDSWRAGDAVGWELDFLKEFTPSMREAAGWIFEMACQVLFLQLLNSSKEAIENWSMLFNRLSIASFEEFRSWRKSTWQAISKIQPAASLMLGVNSLRKSSSQPIASPARQLSLIAR